MRKKLKKLGDAQRHTFQGAFKGVGYKTGFHGVMNAHYLPTILFERLTCDGELLTGHLWCNYTRQFSQLGVLASGDVVQFSARVTSYTKVHYAENRQVDYGLERPTKVQLIGKAATQYHASLPDALDDKNALIGYIMLTNKAYYLANDCPFDEWYVEQFRKWARGEEDGDEA